MHPLVSDRPPELKEERAPDWSPVSSLTADSGKTAVSSVLRRAVVAAIVGVVLWWLGYRLAAGVLLALLVLVTTASVLFPSVATGVDHVMRAVQRVVGQALSLVVLSIVQLLVFTPLSLLFRLAGHDPLALGWSHQSATLWRPSPGWTARPLYRRPFTYERVPAAGAASGVGHRRPFGRLRAVVGLVAIVVLVDVGVGASIKGLRDVTDQTRTQPASLLLFPNAAAGRNDPWSKALGQEANQVENAKIYDPYLGWMTSRFDGKYTHVTDGVRRSYEPPGSDSKRAITVFFFGGSSMFGAFQRDEHTIPSEFARLAEADGIRVRVMNYGQLAYVNWQEVLLFEQLVTGKSVPKVAVFYDGFNELLSQFSLGRHTQPTTLEANRIEARLRASQSKDPSLGNALYRSWANVSVLHQLASTLGLASAQTAKPAALQSPWSGDQAHQPGQRGADAALIYARGVDIARRLAASYGISATFFRQPSIYTKHVVPGEEPQVRSLGADPRAWRTADRVARSRLEPPVIDLGSALDGVRSPVMYDFVHTNELGARAVARGLYDRLRPKLLELSRKKSA